MSRPQAGDRISNYLLDERIAAGNFGEVWKAHHHVFNEAAAIKIPTDPQYVRHLQREGLVIHGLQHPNIVRAIDLDPYADPPYLIMEYVDGRSLRQLIEAHPQGLPLQDTVAILHGVLSALAAAHQAGVIHRDVKPANILIAGGADLPESPARVKVTDFGLGCLSEMTAESMVQSGSLSGEAGRQVAGTVVYMSPEQRDGQELDARSDLYSLGVVLHEMLTGVLPQGTDLPGSMRPGVPSWMDDLFEKAYTRRERRFSSAREMQEVLGRNWPAARPWRSKEGRPRIVQAGAEWRCAECSGLVGVDDHFCIHCGHQLVDRVPRCPACQGYMGLTDRFCILCGADLRGTPAGQPGST